MLEQGYCPVWTGYLERQGDWAVREKEENAGLLVSIITVSYNSEKSIRRTIESVLNQTYSKIEYHIVDGLSTDNTIEIAREYDEKFAEKGIKKGRLHDSRCIPYKRLSCFDVGMFLRGHHYDCPPKTRFWHGKL